MADPKPPIKPYEYTALKDEQIRILHLMPGEREDSVFVQISSEALKDKDMSEYNAVSWEWGTEKATESIRIKNSGPDEHNIYTLAVKPNLLTALKHLRKPDKIERLWVDAICIDQVEQEDVIGSSETKKNIQKKNSEKNSEKSNQIAMMTRIFGTAKQVYVWLGKGTDDSDAGMDFIDKIINLEDSDHITALERRAEVDPDVARRLESLINVLKRGWFSRRWVVQEIAMAKKAMLYCGTRSVEWSKLADAVALLERAGRDGTINRMLNRQIKKHHAQEYVGNISSLPAYRLVQNTTGMFRGQDERGFRTWRRTLEELVSFLAAFKASRLHDTIYAILGLASDFMPVRASDGKNSGPRKDVGGKILAKALTNQIGGPNKIPWTLTKERFEVNYEKPALLVFKEFLQLAINKSQSLDILCRPWAPTKGYDANGKEETIDLPSWITSLDYKPYQPTRDGKMVRYNPDPLVGPAGARAKFYNASGLDKEEFLCAIETHEPLSKCMLVRGWVLDRIGKTWDSGHFGNVPARWLTAGGWTDDKEVPPDELWRTLVGDRNNEGDDPDRWYPLVFQSTVKERGIGFGFETSRLIHESTNTRVVELFRRVQAVVWNRKLMRTEGKYMEWLTGETRPQEERLGALGLAPDDAREGDLLCIIMGCSVPLVLRPIEPKKPEGEPTDAEPANGGLGTLSAPENGTTLAHQRSVSMPVLKLPNSPDEARPPPAEDGTSNSARRGRSPSPSGIPTAATAAANGTSGSNGTASSAAGPSNPNNNAGGSSATNGTGSNGNGTLAAPARPMLRAQSAMVQPTNKGKAFPRVAYQLVGECYVDHMMDGEAITYFNDQEIAYEEFLLE